MKIHGRFSLLIVILLVTLCAYPAFTQEKRVAVFDFEDKTSGSWRWWHGKGVGYGMTDMLVTALVKSEKFKVYERAALDKIMREQKLGQSGNVTQQTAAQVGKLLGVQYAILGSVTEFGYKKGGVGGRIKGVRVGVNKYDAVVAIDVRIVNTETAEILLSETVRKQKSKSSVGISTPKLDFRDKSRFDDSLVGKATREAIDNIVEILDKKIKAGELHAKVIKVDSQGNVIINKGSIAGVKVKDVLYVYREGEALIDPDTGLSLGSELEQIGTIKIIADMLEGKASKAEVISGGDFANGDVVKRN